MNLSEIKSHTLLKFSQQQKLYTKIFLSTIHLYEDINNIITLINNINKRKHEISKPINLNTLPKKKKLKQLPKTLFKIN